MHSFKKRLLSIKSCLSCFIVIEVFIYGIKYHQQVINSACEKVLLNQFHDVLPGTSIKAVYDDSDKMYAEIFDYTNREIENRLLLVAESYETKKGALVYNANSFDLNGIFTLNEKKYFVENVPALGFANVMLNDTESKVILTDRLIENQFYKIIFDADFNIISLFDKRNNREVVKKDRVLNQFKIYEDRSLIYDAWEVEDYHKQKAICLNEVGFTEKFSDNVGAGFIITRNFGNSKIVQKIYLYDNLERIDFETYVDWHEEHCILKTEFSFDVLMNKAIYEIPFGNIERSTHSNTSWDAAKFEVCGHKWVDVSDNSYGVSLLNDCKYGYSCDGDKLTLSLLKASTYPNPESDRGEHTFIYSLLPHKGNYVTGEIVKHAYALNNPLLAVAINDHAGAKLHDSFIICDSENVIVETVRSLLGQR